MKYLLPLILLFSGCASTYKAGHCYVYPKEKVEMFKVIGLTEEGILVNLVGDGYYLPNEAFHGQELVTEKEVDCSLFYMQLEIVSLGSRK